MKKDDFESLQRALNEVKSFRVGTRVAVRVYGPSEVRSIHAATNRQD